MVNTFPASFAIQSIYDFYFNWYIYIYINGFYVWVSLELGVTVVKVWMIVMKWKCLCFWKLQSNYFPIDLLETDQGFNDLEFWEAIYKQWFTSDLWNFLSRLLIKTRKSGKNFWAMSALVSKSSTDWPFTMVFMSLTDKKRFNDCINSSIGSISGEFAKQPLILPLYQSQVT